MVFQILFHGFLVVYETLTSLQITFYPMDLNLMQIIQDSKILHTELEGNTLQILPTTTSSKHINTYVVHSHIPVQAHDQVKWRTQPHKDVGKTVNTLCK
jgi:hypothetical protein